MNCRSFIDRLDEFLEGTLENGERLAFEEHRSDCARCRELCRSFAGDVRTGLEPPDDLVGAVLRATSGSPCRSAHRRLCDHVDGALEPIDAELMRSHLDGCAECSALSRVIGRLGDDLPLLAELRPDSRFVGDVLARTLPRRLPAPRWSDRMAALWQGWIQRPRFALEAAYLGAMLLLVVFGTPSSPLAGVPGQVMRLATLNPVQELREPTARLEAHLSSGVESAWRATGAPVVEVSREAAQDVAQVSAVTLDRLNDDLGTLWERVASVRESNEDDSEPESTQGEER